MSILGAIVRTRPERQVALKERLQSLDNVELAPGDGAPDGRLVVVIEDGEHCGAAATLAEIALWPEVLNTSLVYEHSDPVLEAGQGQPPGQP
jgi:periplasmic nitrate reductase NapD